MRRSYVMGVAAASIIALGAAGTAGGIDQGAQQGAPSQGNRGMGGIVFDPPGTLPKQRTVHITGENPGIHLREKPNGPVVSDLNYWRVTWSPVGTGHVCYLSTGDGKGPNDLRIAFTDNEKLAHYVTYETMAKLLPEFATTPWKIVKGTFGFEGDSIAERKEYCTSDEYKLVATWRKITPGRFSGMDPGNGFFMTFIIPMAAEGELTLNGKRLPGLSLPGPGLPPAYLAFAETWLK